MQVDLSSQFVLTQALARPMVDRGYGKVIFTASLLSFQGGINVLGYAAAKSGVVGLTRALSNEWAGLGVNVNAIAPGYIATDNTQALRDDPDRYRVDPRTHSCWTLGTSRLTWPARRCSSLRRRPTTSTASHFRWTAAGSAAEELGAE